MRKILLVSMLLLSAITIRNFAWGQQPTRLITRSDVTVSTVAIQLCPINGSRVDCSCTNSDAAISIRVGDVNITATRGQRVAAGATFKAITTSAVFGISEAGPAILTCTDQSR